MGTFESLRKQMQARSLINIERFDQAEAILRELIVADPEDRVIHEMLGQIALKRKDFKSAHRHIEKALTLDPKGQMSRTLLFHYLVETRNLTEAEYIIRDLIRDHPNVAVFHRFYAELALMGQAMDRVEFHIDEALRLDPADHSSRMVKFLVEILEGRMNEGSDRLRELIRERPDSEEIISGLCLLLYKQGRYAEALEIGRQILRGRPGEEDLIEKLLTLKIKSHWSTIPLRPFYRFGNAALYEIMVGTYLVSFALEIFMQDDFTIHWFLLTISFIWYSTFYPRLLRRWFRSRGI